MRGISQRELIRYEAIALVRLLIRVSFLLCRYFSAQVGDSLGIDFTAFDQAHDKLFGRAAKHTLDKIAHSVEQDGLFGYGGAIDIGAAFQRAANSSLAMKDVEHRLDGVVCKLCLRRQAFLYMQH